MFNFESCVRLTHQRLICLTILSVSFWQPNFSESADTTDLPARAGSHRDAMTWLNRELTQVAENGPLLVVWLLDESRNMQSDLHACSQSLHLVYEHLSDETETTVASFGSNVRLQTKAPLSNSVPNFALLRKAFDRTPFGESGEENLCKGISFVVKQLSQQAETRGQQIVIIALTDESPSDSGDATPVGDQLEQTIQSCRQKKVQVYVLGSEAIFGTPTARIVWKDPVYQLNHWVQINRGPETAFPGRLQWNGLNKIKDNWPSGFGPYSQERLCRETGGVFFTIQPASNTENFRARRLALKGYEPELATRREESLATSRSQFRSECRNVIEILHPDLDKKLNLSSGAYSTEHEEFLNQAITDFKNGGYAHSIVEEAIKRLEKVRPARELEPSRRWVANYDLLYAQCLTYRVTLIQYLLALDRHAASTPDVSNSKHNRWTIQTIQSTAEPTRDEHARLNKQLNLNTHFEDFVATLVNEQAAARETLQKVIATHPGTPWAQAAQAELDRGLGVSLKSTFHSPRYEEVGRRIKIPAF